MNRKLKVGDWLTIKVKMDFTTWYTDKPLKVIGIDSMTIVVDYDFYPNSYKKMSYQNHILLEYVEYYPMREKKLERILDETD